MIKCTFDESFEFNKTHGFMGLKSVFPNDFYKDSGETVEGTKYWLFIDMPEEIEKRKSEVILAKKKGIKIISLFYDEARFPIIDKLLKEQIIDKLILFDIKYKDRFDVDTFISDYYVEDTIFPDFNKEKNGKTCYFGHMLFDRFLPNKCKHIKAPSFKELYEIASTHSKGYVASTGRGENGGVIYHNKAKYIEMLFCGLEVDCQPGINTLNYEPYKNKIITKKDFDEIKKINKKVVYKIFKEIINL